LGCDGAASKSDPVNTAVASQPIAVIGGEIAEILKILEILQLQLSYQSPIHRLVKQYLKQKK
jgi:hypothetical protein